MTPPPPPTDIAPDRGFEDQVRGMLARRAADVAASDLAADVAASDLAADVARRSVASGAFGQASGRRPWHLAAAAVLVVVLAVGVALARPGGDTGEEVASDDGTTTAATDPATAVVIAGLPAGLTPDELLPLGPPAPTVDGAADAYLADRVGALGPATVVEGALPIIEGGSDWAVRDWWLGTGEAVSADAAPGTLYLRRGDEGWTVVAALSSVFDLRGIAVGRGSLRGSVRSAYPEQWTIGVVGAGRLAAADDWDAVLATLGTPPTGADARSQAIAVADFRDEAPVALLVVGRQIADEVAFTEVAFAPGPR